ncbi:hypothetical protein QBC47DRAFT_388887 [Echria macrotheca]|uniref:Uncharacterized protein n=1 Tax=Echria macrotheca TaxID=438768 RepID=A0AAJ0B6G0_9PEZI|nr:hypothetical protein QBC47DRAFT_388887 [Echria macrotheca]
MELLRALLNAPDEYSPPPSIDPGGGRQPRFRDVFLGDEKQKPRQRLADVKSHRHRRKGDKMRPDIPTRGSSKQGVSLDRLNRQYQNQLDRAEALQGENKKLKDQYGQLKHAFEGVVITHMDERKLLDDSEVREKWAVLSELVYQIVVERYIHDAPKDPGESAKGIEVFGDLVTNPEMWFQDAELREWLFQAFIWRKLTDRIFGENGFSANGNHLSGENRDTYAKCLQALRDDCAVAGRIPRVEYQKFRALMNRILSPKQGTERDRFSCLAAEIQTELSPFQKDPAQPDNLFSHKFERLINAAVDMDVDMAQCRSWYQVSMGNVRTRDESGQEPGRPGTCSGVEFDMELMENAIDRRTKRGKVILFVTPLMVKWGDTDGNNFNDRKVLARQRVIVSGERLQELTA